MVVVSAPGKVLLAGGYLILDRPHTGTVLALDARFFSAVEMRPPAAAALPGEVEVSVASPQFGERLIPGSTRAPTRARRRAEEAESIGQVQNK